jgi:hypothetical protein
VGCVVEMSLLIPENHHIDITTIEPVWATNYNLILEICILALYLLTALPETKNKMRQGACGFY